MSDWPAWRILADDLILAATLSASPSLESTLPVGNLRTLERSEVARSTSASDQVISGNFAASSPVSCCVLWRHNLTTAATWRLELFNAINQGGTKVYDSTAVAAFFADPLEALLADYGADLGEWEQPAQAAVLYFQEVTARSFRLTLSDSANPAGYLQASRLMIGAYWEPSIGADYGHEFQWVDPSVQARAASGVLRTPIVRGPVRQLSFDCSQLSMADSAALTRIIGRIGLRAGVWISLYPGWTALDSQYADIEYLHGFVAKLGGPHAAARRTWSTWSDRLQFVEV
jgi:hypothetical protein